jgi:hypothetical protein
VVELVNPVEAGAPLVMSPTNEEQKMVTKVPAQSVAEKLPLVTCVEARRNIKLKVKGTHSSFDQSVGRTSLNSGSFPLFDNFPFTRLTVEEIAELFSSYRIKLGDNAQHRNTLFLLFRPVLEIVLKTLLSRLLIKVKLIHMRWLQSNN